jgi:hypothetical protein
MNYETLLATYLEEDSQPVDYLKTLSVEQLSAIVKEGMVPPVKPALLHPPAPKKALTKMHESVGGMKEAIQRMSDTAKKTGFTKVSALKIATVAGWARDLARADMEKLSEKKDRAPKTKRERAEGWSNTGALFGALRQASKNKNPVVGAMTGYGAGRLAHRVIRGPASDEKLKQSSVELMRALMEKEGAIPGMLAGIAGKVLPAAKAAVTKAAPIARSALQATAGTSLKQRALVGAGLGAAAGGARQMMRSPQERQGHSLLGSMAGGAVKGSIGGAAAGPFAQKALQSKALQQVSA